MIARPRRVLGYARVSSEEQARGSSLQDQQDAIAAYAKSVGLKVARFYVEAESAVHEKIERRVQIRELLAEVRKGDLVLCHRLDRWSRDPEFTYKSVRELLEKGVSFYAIEDRCDPSTSEGDTMLGFRILFAREEHKRIKQRLVGTRKVLRDHGYYVEGLPPIGYRRVGGKGVGKNVLAVDAKEAAIVKTIFKLAIAGASMTRIAAKLDVKRDLVADTLNRRIYVGEIPNSAGTWIRGKHPAIIDADTFARARAAVSTRRLGGARPRDRASETSTWILRDVARCGLCGSRMSSAYGGPHDARRYYYKCSKSPKQCASKFVPVRPIESSAEPLVLARLSELREDLAREPKSDAPTTRVIDFTERRSKLQRKRDRYLEAFADEHMDREELRVAMAKLDGEVLRLDAEEQAARRPRPLADAKVRREMLREVRTLTKAWESAGPEDRRRIVGNLAKGAGLEQGKPCRFAWRSIEEMAEESA